MLGNYKCVLTACFTTQTLHKVKGDEKLSACIRIYVGEVRIC